MVTQKISVDKHKKTLPNLKISESFSIKKDTWSIKLANLGYVTFWKWVKSETDYVVDECYVDTH